MLELVEGVIMAKSTGFEIELLPGDIVIRSQERQTLKGALGSVTIELGDVLEGKRGNHTYQLSCVVHDRVYYGTDTVVTSVTHEVNYGAQDSDMTLSFVDTVSRIVRDAKQVLDTYICAGCDGCIETARNTDVEPETLARLKTEAPGVYGAIIRGVAASPPTTPPSEYPTLEGSSARK